MPENTQCFFFFLLLLNYNVQNYKTLHKGPVNVIQSLTCNFYEIRISIKMQ